MGVNLISLDLRLMAMARDSMRLQSAMEYLMTYGWAILVIAVVLGVLYSLGVFNPSNFAPKAQPGSCQVFRPNGPGTSYDLNLEGTCNGELPQYVAYFNGQSYFQMSSNQYVPIEGNAVTITAWINPSQTSSVGQVVSVGGNAWNYLIETGTEFSFCFIASNGGGTCVVNPKPLRSNTWYFVAGGYNPSDTTAFAYIDGSLETSNFGTMSYEPPYQTVRIGTSQSGTIQFFSGMIANVQVYNATLSGEDVNALYAEGIGGAPIKPQNLVGWWPLNGDGNDYSGNLNGGTGHNVEFSGSWLGAYATT